MKIRVLVEGGTTLFEADSDLIEIYLSNAEKTLRINGFAQDKFLCYEITEIPIPGEDEVYDYYRDINGQKSFFQIDDLIEAIEEHSHRTE